MIVTDAMIAAWSPLVPRVRDLPAAPQRLVIHWTGGGPDPSAYERTRYHYLVTQPTGYVVPGVPVALNMRRISRAARYAAHTGGMNSFSVGLAFCGMLGAGRGRRFGRYPLAEHQVRRGLAFVAFACRLWGLDPANPAHLFTHHEAWTLHRVKGAANDAKWDVNELAFAPELAPDQVGDWLRAECRATYDTLHLVCP